MGAMPGEWTGMTTRRRLSRTSSSRGGARAWLALPGLLLCLAVLGGARAAPPAPRPNILFPGADEYRYDCLGIAGHPLVKTPNFDRLAREGVRFTRAYVAAPVCSPSRATLFTGRYPQLHGVTQNGMALKPGEVG